ncbi:MAG: hypothetical protein VB071_15580, partial [Lawsonibacter sp.]|nr:hypothetical protein [Lawsonibacter sp.]
MNVHIEKKFSRRRLAALVLASALGVALLLGIMLFPASAYRSLSHIETIKQTKSVFTVLELVPQAGTGSMGYYVPGQEPTANWYAQIAKVGPSGSVTGPEARKAWADTLFQQLTDNGMMSSGDLTPLTSVAAYAEEFPWANDCNPSGTQLYLTNADGTLRTEKERTTVRGTFQYQGIDSAEFDQISVPILVGEGESGTHVQHILRFSYATEQADGFYYYNPTFATVDIGNIDSYEGKALYLSIPADDTSNPTYGTETPVEIKRYAGTLGQDGFALDLEQSYYCMTQTGRPSAAWSVSAPYRAEADGFAEESGGYFNMTVDGYTFVGSGKGNYSFEPNNSAAPVPVQYDHVYVSGGYSNNNWFLTDVFDEADAAIAVRVYSVVPGETDASSLNNMLEKADMIVLSAGFNLAGSGGSLAGLYTAGNNDLTASQTTLIQQALANERPILVDGQLKDGSANINQLVSDLMGSKSTAFVQNNLYCFLPDSSGTTRKALATCDFALPFDAGYSTEGDPYYPVMAEITYENFLRSQAGGVDPLPSSVTMGNCIRYIINYSGQRVQNVKSEINVLELQP